MVGPDEFFVLHPGTDLAARRAVRAYVEDTKNGQLIAWMDELDRRDAWNRKKTKENKAWFKALDKIFRPRNFFRGEK